MMYTECVRIS